MTDTPFEVVTYEVPREQWLEARKSGIGSSDVAAILGVSANKSALGFWCERTGHAEPENLDDNDLVQCGRDLEDVIRDVIYPRKSGRPSRRDGRLLRSTVHTWAQCTLDGWTCAPGNTFFHPLEIKNVASFSESAWEDGAPLKYLVQCQHQMLVTGAPLVTICALIGGCKPVWQDVERDETLIGMIVDKGADMWRRIQEDDAPPPDASDSSARAIKAMFPQHEEGKSVTLPAAHRETEAEYIELTKELADKKKRLAHISNTLKAAIGDAELGVFPGGGAFSYRTDARGARRLRHHPRRI
jgi:putative phage-type endonuclease